MIICQLCGETNPDDAERCSRCGDQLTTPSEKQSPPRTSAMARWSLVCGIIGLITFFLPVLSILAIILGAVALSRIGNNKGRLVGSRIATIGLVLGIISFLFLVFALEASIHFPSFYKARNRVKVSRIQNDLRTLATALESFYVDNKTYPLSDKSTFQDLGRIIMLTTPTAYITSIPSDPFNPVPHGPYCYYADHAGKGWMLWSAGPDGKYDLTAQNAYGMLYTNNPRISDNPTLWALTYDATNGTKSSGDIWRAGGQTSQPYVYDPTNGTVSEGPNSPWREKEWTPFP